MTKNNNNILTVTNAQKRFGGIVALADYSLSLQEGELVGLIGPNGAGKTTAFNVLSGVLAPTSGTIFFGDKDITSHNAHQSARVGIARTFQNIRLFNDMTVLDNIRVGLHHHHGVGLWSTLLCTPAFRRSEKLMLEKAHWCASIMGLEKYLHLPVQELSYGNQRVVEIARALALEPKVLLLDEPAAGMNPHETIELTTKIKLLNKELNLAILIVEHDMQLIMNLCDRLQVLNYGSLLAEGLPEEIRNNQDVIDAYLGTGRKEKKI